MQIADILCNSKKKNIVFWRVTSYPDEIFLVLNAEITSLKKHC